MQRLLLDEHIRSVTDFRTNITEYLKKIKESKRPLALTQHGKCSAVIMDVQEYEKMMSELELLKEIRDARNEIANGETISNEEALNRLSTKFD